MIFEKVYPIVGGCVISKLEIDELKHKKNEAVTNLTMKHERDINNLKAEMDGIKATMEKIDTHYIIMVFEDKNYLSKIDFFLLTNVFFKNYVGSGQISVVFS